MLYYIFATNFNDYWEVASRRDDSSPKNQAITHWIQEAELRTAVRQWLMMEHFI
jgi:hypothetical protein